VFVAGVPGADHEVGANSSNVEQSSAIDESNTNIRLEMAAQRSSLVATGTHNNYVEHSLALLGLVVARSRSARR
jgi:hypothetical protein